jgi:Sucrase/ferredoxin-like
VTEPARPGLVGVPDRCAPSAERRGDQMHGTASPVPRWLLVEQPGPWGRDALVESELDDRVARTLAARAAHARVRVVLIRRPGRSGRADRRRWALVDSRPGRESCWWGEWSAATDLLELPLDGPLTTTPTTAPVYLVCAHGRHDACCAIRGRPVAATLAATRPGATWECSHVGGDRFAANLVVLPHGLYYGHVTPPAAARLAGLYESGRVDPTWLRGRSSIPLPVQAAQHYARLAFAEDRLDALHPLDAQRLDERTWKVWLAADPEPALVTVRAGAAVPARLTCSSRRAEPARIWELVSLTYSTVSTDSRSTEAEGG